MLSYVLNIIIVLLTYFICNALPIKKENKNKFFLIIAFIELFLILSLREPISDMIRYCQYYSIIGEMSWNELINFDWEIGYTVLNKILYMINQDERFFIVVTSALTLIGPYVFIKKYSNNYLMSLIMFIAMNFFSNNYYILRQMLALSILLISVSYIKNRKFIKFTICVLVATLFHKSSILFLVGYFLFNIKITNKYLNYLIIIFIALVPLRNIIVRYISGFIYQEYSGIQTSSGYTLLIIMLMVYGIMYIAHLTKKTNNKDTIFYNQFIMAIVLQIFATSQSVISRLVVDYYVAIIIFLPNIIEKIEIKQRLLVKLLAYLVLFLIALFGYSNIPNYIIGI